MARYTEKLFDAVRVEKDILFATFPGLDGKHTPTDLYMDVYMPEGDTEENRRAILLVHGGGFVGGDRRQGYIVTLGNLLAQYGYVCFSLEYRMFNKGERPKYPTAAPYAAMDIEYARQYIAENKERFRIDPAKMAICGGSAGGMGSLEACRIHTAYTAFVCLWGTYDNAMVPSSYPPTILIHGTADQSVSYAFSEAFYAKLQEKGIPTELIPLEDAPHTAIKWLGEFEERMIRFLDTYAV